MTFDVVVVGSGINSLACAALLARGGKRVVVLERNDYLGGAIRTGEITEPGFVHEVFSSWHPLFAGSAAYEELKDELHARGLEYLNTELPTGTLLEDGSSAFLTTSREVNAAELECHAPGDGEAWERTVAKFMPNADLSFGVLTTELWSAAGLKLAGGALRRLGKRGALEFTGGVLASCRDWASETSPHLTRTGCWHRGCCTRGSGQMRRLGVHHARDRGRRRARRDAGPERRGRPARRRPRRDRPRPGGELQRADVEQVVFGAAGQPAFGSRAAEGGGPRGRRRQRHADPALRPASYRGPAARGGVRGGPALPLRQSRHADPDGAVRRPRWHGDERLGRAAIVHLTPGLDGVSRAVNEAERGLLPADATIVVGQPLAVDPSRAPEGSWIGWIQFQELPPRVQGDAAGEIDIGDGTWTRAAERYVDRSRPGSHGTSQTSRPPSFGASSSRRPTSRR